MPPRRRQNLASCRVLADGHALPTGRLRRLRCSSPIHSEFARDAAMRDELMSSMHTQGRWERLQAGGCARTRLLQLPVVLLSSGHHAR